MDFKDIIKIFDTYGWFGGMTILILAIIFILVKNKWLTGLWTKVSEKIVERFMKSKTSDVATNLRTITESDITNHDIFNYIEFWTYSKIP